MFSYILFDLDGTLTDPKLGITTCVQYALEAAGIGEPDRERLTCFIGPSLKDSFMEYYGMSEAQAQAAVVKYRERFSVTGLYENDIYPGMHKLLWALKDDGRHLAVASSKPTVFVRRILEHFEIADCFEVVAGSELDGSRGTKEEVIRAVLAYFFPEGHADTDACVMVGDRKFDIEGAKQLGLHQIGVSYGYAQGLELEEAGAETVVDDVSGLGRALGLPEEKKD